MHRANGRACHKTWCASHRKRLFPRVGLGVVVFLADVLPQIGHFHAADGAVAGTGLVVSWPEPAAGRPFARSGRLVPVVRLGSIVRVRPSLALHERFLWNSDAFPNDFIPATKPLA